jgi:hypothetical protein
MMKQFLLTVSQKKSKKNKTLDIAVKADVIYV